MQPFVVMRPDSQMWTESAQGTPDKREIEADSVGDLRGNVFNHSLCRMYAARGGEKVQMENVTFEERNDISIIREDVAHTHSHWWRKGADGKCHFRRRGTIFL